MPNCPVTVVVRESKSAPIVVDQVKPVTVVTASGGPSGGQGPEGKKGIAGPSTESHPYVITGIVVPESLPPFPVYVHEETEEQFLENVICKIRIGTKVVVALIRNGETVPGLAEVNVEPGDFVEFKPSETIKLKNLDSVWIEILENIGESYDLSFAVGLLHKAK